MALHDLDSLAVEPLSLKVGGKEYAVKVTVGAMIKATAKATEGNAFDLVAAAMEEAGMPREVFFGLSPAQGIELNRLVTEHFFPASGPEEAGEPSSGLKLLLPSSEPSEEPTSTETT